MLKKLPCAVAVDGFSVNITARPDNLASGVNDKGAHLLEDGYLLIEICNDGSNVFWPDAFTDFLVVVRLQASNDTPEIISEYEICVLGADDSPVKIILKERVIGETFGVWLMVACESPNAPEPNEFAGYPILIEEARHVS